MVCGMEVYGVVCGTMVCGVWYVVWHCDVYTSAVRVVTTWPQCVCVCVCARVCVCVW